MRMTRVSHQLQHCAPETLREKVKKKKRPHTGTDHTENNGLGRGGGERVLRCPLQPCYRSFNPADMPDTNRVKSFNRLNPELNPVCYLLALLGAHHFLHVSRIRVKSLTFRLLMSYVYIYIYGAPILDVSRSHTTTQHSR